MDLGNARETIQHMEIQQNEMATESASANDKLKRQVCTLELQLSDLQSSFNQLSSTTMQVDQLRLETIY